MCCDAEKLATEKFLKNKKPGDRVVVWKIIKEHYNWDTKIGYVTPYRQETVNAGWFKAYNWKLLKRKKMISDYENYSITEGIHCYLTRSKAREYVTISSRKVIRCEAYVRDFLGCDKDGHAVFKKIWIPKEQIK